MNTSNPTMSRPRLLDLGCKAGGCTRGYQLAGFHVTGVDVEPQPHYIGDEFIQADAMTVPLGGYDAYSSSMPCHDHTPLRSLAGLNGTGWLLAGVRDRLHATGKPYVIENVPGAPMRPDLKLCGCMFGLRLERVRWFELGNWPGLIMAPEHKRLACRSIPTVTKGRRAAWDQGLKVSITGDVGSYLGPEAMGIDWMTGNELSQAIPPPYTEYIGRQLMECLNVTGDAA